MQNPRSASRPDAAPRELWGPVTVRVAWDLVLGGITVRPDVLAEAREHVLRCLPAGCGPAEAEELSSVFVGDWLDRVRKARYRRPRLDPDRDIAISRAWRHRLASALDQVGDAVFRLHYGDGFTLVQVSRSVALDVGRLEGARAGIREAMKLVAWEDGLELSGWPAERLDRLVGRVARAAEAGCPGPGGLLTDEGRRHADRCPRCARAVRLVKGGALAPGDLFPSAAPVATGDLRLLGLLLHPDARKHHAAVAAALGDLALPVASDGWVIDARHLDELAPVLEELALAGTPARHHLRGALVCASGRWVKKRLLGPAPLVALEEARAQPWGEIQGVAELPAPLPPPPKATRWWAAAGVAVVLAVAAAGFSAMPRELPPTWPLQAEFVTAPDGWQVRFDTDELAVVDVVARVDGQLQVVHSGVRAEKGRWATLGGDFQVEIPGEEVLVITSAGGIPGLHERVARLRSEADPVGALVDDLRAEQLRVGLARSPRPEPSTPR